MVTRPVQPDASWWTTTTSSWNGRLLSDILANRDIAVLFQFLSSRGFSRAAIAAHTGIAENRVSAIAKGRQHVEAYAVLVRICEGLTIPREMMGLGLGTGQEPAWARQRIAVCGSRGPGTQGQVIDAAVLALSSLFEGGGVTLQHGPRGIGIEVVTYIANHYRPRHLQQAVGIFGHANVVRDVSAAIVVGGGQGTHDEVDLAIVAGVRLIPLPASGGAALRAYGLMSADIGLRKWMDHDDFVALETCCDIDTITEIVRRLVDASQEGAPHA